MADLGDAAARFIHRATGIKPCGGCGQRQEALNRFGDRVVDGVLALIGSPRKSILVRCYHGVGDAVVATVIVRHLAQWHDVDVVAPHGHQTAFLGTARRAYSIREYPRHKYAETITLDLPEPTRTWEHWPATKAEHWLVRHGIEPQPELCRWRLNPTELHIARASECVARHGGGRPVLLVHYQGESARAAKDLSEGTAAAICRAAIDCGAAPVVVDHAQRSPLPSRGLAVRIDGDDPVWGGGGFDAATLGALGLAARLCVGIDSGPGHCWVAAGARTLIAWPTALLHPLHFFAPSATTTHWIGADHFLGLRGDYAPGAGYFATRYEHVVAAGAIGRELPSVVSRLCRSAQVIGARSGRGSVSAEIYVPARWRNPP